MSLTYAVLYAASGDLDQYKDIFARYDVSEIGEKEKVEGVWGEFSITFRSLEEFDQFCYDIRRVVVGTRALKDGGKFRTLVIYDDYLE